MAVTTKKDQWISTFADSIGASTQNPQDGGGEQKGTLDKYDSLKYTSYKDMLSSKIQASVARDQAAKYVGNSLANTGFGGQGMAESTRAGILGTYNRAIQDADVTHQANLMNIENQRQEDLESESTDKWQSAMTMLQQASSQEDLDYVKNNLYADMSDEQKKMFDYYYASYGRDLESNDVQANAQWAERVIQTAEIKEKDGMSYNKAVNSDDLIKRIGFNPSGGEDLRNFYMTANDGDLVQVNSGSETKYLMYYNGKLYYVDDALVQGRTPKVTYTVNK